MKTARLFLTAVCAVAAAFSLFVPSVRADDPSSVKAILERTAQSQRLAPALEEIVKLTKSGVADAITLAYIQTSATPYSLDAQDVIRLQQQGVSPQVITAMMQHGEQLRKTAEVSKQSQATAAPVATAATQPTAPAPAVTYVQTPASTVSVTYIGYPRYDYYPGYYGYGIYSPTYYSYAPRYVGYGRRGPRVGFGHPGVHAGYYGGFGHCR